MKKSTIISLVLTSVILIYEFLPTSLDLADHYKEWCNMKDKVAKSMEEERILTSEKSEIENFIHSKHIEIRFSEEAEYEVAMAVLKLRNSREELRHIQVKNELKNYAVYLYQQVLMLIFYIWTINVIIMECTLRGLNTKKLIGYVCILIWTCYYHSYIKETFRKSIIDLKATKYLKNSTLNCLHFLGIIWLALNYSNPSFMDEAFANVEIVDQETVCKILFNSCKIPFVICRMMLKYFTQKVSLFIENISLSMAFKPKVSKKPKTRSNKVKSAKQLDLQENHERIFTKLELREPILSIDLKSKHYMQTSCELMIDGFRCVVCNELPKASGSILACKNEHLICIECSKDRSTKACPICNINLKKQRPKRRYQGENFFNVLLEFEQISLRSKKSEFKKEVKELVDSKRNIFECPICFETIRRPLKIFSCSNDHYICCGCLKDSHVKSCPICRESFEERQPKRRFHSENILEFLLKHS